MAELPEFVKFYPGITPDVYWNLEVTEYLVLKEYLRLWKKEQEAAQRKMKSKTMTGR